MTSSHPNVPIDDYVVDYADRLFREVIRMIAIIRRGFDADDIAASVVEEFLRRPDVIMMKYPDPARFAGQRTRHAGISHDRRERAQRGEGVRLDRTDDGLMQPRRRVVSGHKTVGEGGSELYAMVADPRGEFESQVVDQVDARALFRRCCHGLSQAEVHEVWLVDGCGWEVAEVAEWCGQARETVSRRINATRRRIRQNHVQMLQEQEHLA